MNRRQLSNPCHLGYPVINDKQRAVKAVHDVHGYYERIDEQRPIQHANVLTFYDKYERVVELLKQAGLEKYTKLLTYVLAPVFCEETCGVHDSKVGGTPGIIHHFTTPISIAKHHKQEVNLTNMIERMWPRCGCCHEPMVFVGQFDLHPWAAPIHCATEFQLICGDGRPWPVSGIGNERMAQYGSIFANKMLHVFMCRTASYHFDNPNGDCFALITSKYKNEDRTKDLPNDTEFHEALVAAGYDKHTFGSLTEDEPGVSDEILHKKITGHELFFEFDCGRASVKKRDELDELAEEHPELFLTYDRCEYKLFGEARSQQEAKRPFSSNSYAGPRVLTPTLYFSDDNADMSYQLYFDLIGSDGYKAYGKTDASCT